MITWFKNWLYDFRDPFGKRAHNKTHKSHRGKYGHYCWEWDGLWICAECGEFHACRCFDIELETIREHHAKELKRVNEEVIW